MLPTIEVYNIETIKDEIRQLVDKGKLRCNEPICHACRFISPREWTCFECELERNDYLPRDWIIDLLGNGEWAED